MESLPLPTEHWWAAPELKLVESSVVELLRATFLAPPALMSPLPLLLDVPGVLDLDRFGLSSGFGFSFCLLGWALRRIHNMFAIRTAKRSPHMTSRGAGCGRESACCPGEAREQQWPDPLCSQNKLLHDLRRAFLSMRGRDLNTAREEHAQDGSQDSNFSPLRKQ